TFTTMLPDENHLFNAQSPIAGEGVFCRGPIVQGKVVLSTMSGRRVHRSEDEKIDWATYQGRIMQIDDNWLFEGTGDLVDFVNHCCEPNVGFDETGDNLIALRDIDAGEEIFFHYSMSENHADWSIPCACGARRCLGRIVGFRDLPLAERARLLP